MTRLQELYQRAGQSPWLDNLKRSYLTSGRLAELVSSGIRGLTSNPTIMARAIATGEDYDDEFSSALESGQSVEDAYWDLVVSDVVGALGVLRPVFDQSGGGDGFVSIEVSPSLAHDTAGTINSARDLHRRIVEPNLFVKIPATLEGLGAIETMIAEGHSINVTLIFSLERYHQVVESYLSGLEKLLSAGGDLSKVSSVASFFVSRVDTEVDRRLEEIAKEDPGSQRGARPRAARDRGDRPGQACLPGLPQLVLRGPLGTSRTGRCETPASALGLDLDQEPRLRRPRLCRVARRARHRRHPARGDRRALLGPRPGHADGRGRHRPGKGRLRGPWRVRHRRRRCRRGARERGSGLLCRFLRRPFRQAAREVHLHQGEEVTSALLARLEARDPGLWPEGNVSANRLGWLDSPRNMLEKSRHLSSFAASIDQDTVVLLGMGGSSLGPEVLAAVRDSHGSVGARRFVVCDTTDPATVASLPLEEAFIIVSSKSGTTLEPTVLFSYARSRVPDPARYAVITDPATPLAVQAGELGIRHLFENQPDIGGRYSVMSHFGLVPAALMGYDVAELCERALDVDREEAVALGEDMGRAALAGRDKTTIVVDEKSRSFGLWVEQLIAESTGKQGRGIVPVPTTEDEQGEDRHVIKVVIAARRRIWRASSSASSWPSRRPATRSRSTPSTSRTWPSPRRTPRGCSAPCLCRRWSRRPQESSWGSSRRRCARTTTSRSRPMCPSARTTSSRPCAGGVRDANGEMAVTVGYGPGSCTRPASSTRAARTRSSPCSSSPRGPPASSPSRARPTTSGP